MNKREVDDMLPRAYPALEQYGIAVDKVINSTYRGQISSFGAAVAMGSLRSAVAFFSTRGGSQTERQNLMKAIHHLVDPENDTDESSMWDYINRTDNNAETKEKVINAAIALKLAMNLYVLK